MALLENMPEFWCLRPRSTSVNLGEPRSGAVKVGEPGWPSMIGTDSPSGRECGRRAASSPGRDRSSAPAKARTVPFSASLRARTVGGGGQPARYPYHPLVSFRGSRPGPGPSGLLAGGSAHLRRPGDEAAMRPAVRVPRIHGSTSVTPLHEVCGVGPGVRQTRPHKTALPTACSLRRHVETVHPSSSPLAGGGQSSPRSLESRGTNMPL